jgi:hypothetical protein
MLTEQEPTYTKTFLDSLLITVTRITRYVAFTVLWSLLQAVAVKFLWNFVAPGLLQFTSSMSYAQALGLVFLVRILSRAWIKDATHDLAVMQLEHQRYIDNSTYGILGYLYSRFGVYTEHPEQAAAAPADKTLN